MEKEQKDNSFMMKLATMIVDKRKGFYLVFILLIIFSLISMNKVKVNNDLTTYLSDDTETRQGMDLMNGQFITYGTARIMVCNVTFEEAVSALPEEEYAATADTVPAGRHKGLYEHSPIRALVSHVLS